VPLVEQELLTLPEHPSSYPIFSGVRVSRPLVLYVSFVYRCLSFVLFLLAIVLSVFLRYTDLYYPFKLLLYVLIACSHHHYTIECIAALLFYHFISCYYV